MMAVKNLSLNWWQLCTFETIAPVFNVA